jgi:hypothetical protein
MTLIVIALIAATPLIFWFLRRRTKPRGDEVRPGGPPATINSIADTNTDAAVEVERFPERPVAEQAEAEPGRELATVSYVEDIDEAHEDSNTVAHHKSELQLIAEGNSPKLVVNDSAGSSQVLPAASSDETPSPRPSERFLEHEESATEVGIPNRNSQYSTEKPIVSEATGTAILGNQHMAPNREFTPIDPQFPSDELLNENVQPEQEQPHELKEEAHGESNETTPPRYRPPAQRPPRQAAVRPVSQKTERIAPVEVRLEILVRLKFDRFDSCEMTLLPERSSELDNELDVKSAGIPLHLVAQGDWYQDLQFENIGDLLRQGLELKGQLADDRRARWLLSGRDVHVLASHPRASYFVSTTRLALGRSHIVLCVTGLLQVVEAILNEGGCQGYTKLGESHGVPSGWVGLRGVSPSKAIPLGLGSDPFYALKPAPDIEIELEGGVCLRNSVWLAGYPPQIKLFGQLNSAVRILIDGKEAQSAAEGSLVVDGYDISGQHTVYCEGLSCSSSYSIEEAPDGWQAWPGYRFGEADICGPLVQPTLEGAGRRVFSVPMSNPLLLGAEPGQIFRCSSRSVTRWKGFVPFDVVWALPAHPLTCDKRSARILQLSDAPVASSKNRTKPAPLGWCNAILDASRKGLRIDTGSSDSAARWVEYKKMARDIRKGRR